MDSSDSLSESSNYESESSYKSESETENNNENNNETSHVRVYRPGNHHRPINYNQKFRPFRRKKKKHKIIPDREYHDDVDNLLSRYSFVQEPSLRHNLAGIPGPCGTRGLRGLRGSDGLDGITGEKGLSGDIGPTGPAGGKEGKDGNTGKEGPTGNTGKDGKDGDLDLYPNFRVETGSFDFETFPFIDETNGFSVINNVKGKYIIKYKNPFTSTFVPVPSITNEQIDPGSVINYAVYNITKNGFVIEFLYGREPYKTHFMVISRY